MVCLRRGLWTGAIRQELSALWSRLVRSPFPFPPFPSFLLPSRRGAQSAQFGHVDEHTDDPVAPLAGRFDSTKRYWLVLEDPKVAIQLPAYTLAAFPSALIVHYNLHVVEGDSAEAVLAGKGETRGSLVLFTQADDVSLRELGCTMTAAKLRGLKAEWGGLSEIFKMV